MAALGLCCFGVDFSVVAGGRGSSLVAVGRLSSCGTRALEHRLSSCSSVAPWHVGSSQTRDRTCAPCIGRRILIHCATKEVLTDIIIIDTRIQYSLRLTKIFTLHRSSFLHPRVSTPWTAETKKNTREKQEPLLFDPIAHPLG